MKTNFDGLDRDELEQLKEVLVKERKKLQTVNSHYHAQLRTLARNEMLNEQIVEAIRNLEPIQIKKIKHNSNNFKSTGLLAISDIHAGSEYVIHGLGNEIVNEYNFEIMKDRLWKLIGLVETDAVDYDEVVVAICGDVFENILRMTSFEKVKEPVIDTVIKTSEFLCQWLAELQDRLDVKLKVVTVGGNHDTCSFLGSKPRFDSENLTKLVVEFMKIRFEKHPHIIINEYKDVAVVNIQGVNVMFEHGMDKDLQTTIEFYSNLYNVDIDEIIAGHLHRPESKAIGITDFGDRMFYRVGSICGCDTFSKKIRQVARPSAYFALYEKDQGHTWSRNYYL